MESTPSDERNRNVRFSVEKCKSYDTSVKPSESNINLLASESAFDEDDVFEPGSSRLKFSLSRGSSTTSRSRQTSAQFYPEKKQTTLKIFVAFLGLAIIAIVVLVWHFFQLQTIINVTVSDHILAKVDVKAKSMVVMNSADIAIVKVKFDSDMTVSNDLKSLRYCSPPSESSLCLSWSSTNSSLSIQGEKFKDSGDDTYMGCVKVSWKTSSPSVPNDCVQLASHKLSENPKPPTVWFGSHDYIFWNQNFTSSAKCASEQCMPYIPGGYTPVQNYEDLLKYRGGNVVEPTWFSSDGVVVKASNHHPVNVCTELCDTQKEPTLCMSPLLDPSHQKRYHDGEGYHLDYIVCTADSLPRVHRKTSELFLKPTKETLKSMAKPFADIVNDGAYFEDDLEQNILNSSMLSGGIIDGLVANCESLFIKPVWSIVIKSENFNIVDIRNQLRPISKVGGTCSLTDAEQVYRTLGDFVFRKDAHLSTEEIITVLKELSLSVMLPVTPFINYDSINFGPAAENRYLITNTRRTAPVLTAISSKLFPAIIDLTNTNASRWYVKQIVDFTLAKEIEYIHFFYGQAIWLPHSDYNLQNPLHNIGHFSTLYTDVASRAGQCSISDVAYDSQLRNQLVLLSPANNIRDTLSSVLSAGLAGYPFVVANFPHTLQETYMLMSRGALLEELIRWVQLVAFFPVMHLPWNYEILIQRHIDISFLINITQTYLSVRNSPDVWPKLKDAINTAELNSSRPVVAPMWMAPNALSYPASNEQIVLIRDQFMIGPDLFVAPILDVGQEHRTIYFPPGEWRDIVSNNDVDAKTGKWMKNYLVKLRQIPVFVRIEGTLE